MSRERGRRGRKGNPHRKDKQNNQNTTQVSNDLSPIDQLKKLNDEAANETSYCKFIKKFNQLAEFFYSAAVDESTRMNFTESGNFFGLFAKMPHDIFLMKKKSSSSKFNLNNSALMFLNFFKKKKIFGVFLGFFKSMDFHHYTDFRLDEVNIEDNMKKIKKILDDQFATLEKNDWLDFLTGREFGLNLISFMTYILSTEEKQFVLPFAFRLLFKFFDEQEIPIAGLLNEKFNRQSMTGAKDLSSLETPTWDNCLSTVLRYQLPHQVIHLLLTRGAEPHLLQEIEGFEKILINYLNSDKIPDERIGIMGDILEKAPNLITYDIGKTYLSLESTRKTKLNGTVCQMILERFPSILFEEINLRRQTFCSWYLQTKNDYAIKFTLNYLKVLNTGGAKEQYLELLSQHLWIPDLICLWGKSGTSPAEIKECLNFLKETDPDLYTDLLCIKKNKEPILFSFLLSLSRKEVDIFNLLLDQVSEVCSRKGLNFDDFFLAQDEKNGVWISAFHACIHDPQNLTALCYHYPDYINGVNGIPYIPSLLDFCIDKHAISALKVLSFFIEKSFIMPSDGNYPIEIALQKGNPKILKVLLESISRTSLDKMKIPCRLSLTPNNEVKLQIEIYSFHKKEAITYCKILSVGDINNPNLLSKVEELDNLLTQYAEHPAKLLKFIDASRGNFEDFGSQLFDQHPSSSFYPELTDSSTFPSFGDERKIKLKTKKDVNNEDEKISNSTSIFFKEKRINLQDKEDYIQLNLPSPFNISLPFSDLDKQKRSSALYHHVSETLLKQVFHASEKDINEIRENLDLCSFQSARKVTAELFLKPGTRLTIPAKTEVVLGKINRALGFLIQGIRKSDGKKVSVIFFAILEPLGLNDHKGFQEIHYKIPFNLLLDKKEDDLQISSPNTQSHQESASSFIKQDRGMN